MDKKIKKIVELNQIHEYRERFIQTKKVLFKMERKMANLTLDYEVGTYVHALDEYEDLRIKKNTTNGVQAEKITLQMLALGKKIKKTNEKNNPKIVEYLKLKEEYFALLDAVGDYAKSINIDFRKSFYEYHVPDIYVFQGYVDNKRTIVNAKNIVLPDTNLLYRDTKATIIFPITDITSNRDLRHFYNKVSFKYLEDMTNDYEFNLENKNIGKVKIIKK